MKKLKIPMQVPILSAGRLSDKMAQGIAKMLAQAIPIPIIEPYMAVVLSKKQSETNPIPPKLRQSACVSLRPIFFAIGIKSKAKSIALNHAGVSAANADFIRVELDYDDGIKVYEIEFDAGDFEYEYEINAKSGKIRDYDKEYRWD